jgi:hypothetical protein
MDDLILYINNADKEIEISDYDNIVTFDIINLIISKLNVITKITINYLKDNVLILQLLDGLLLHMSMYQSFKYLSFFQCNITNQETIRIAQLLNLNTITSLSLIDGNIDHIGLKELGEAIKINTSLEYLSLHNSIDIDSDSSYIIDSLCHNKSIIELDLSKNCMYNYNYSNLNLMLKKNNTLKKLLLWASDSGEMEFGINVIMKDSLLLNNTLTFLDISFNNYNNDITLLIIKMMNINKNINVDYDNYDNDNDNCI